MLVQGAYLGFIAPWDFSLNTVRYVIIFIFIRLINWQPKMCRTIHFKHFIIKSSPFSLEHLFYQIAVKLKQFWINTTNSTKAWLKSQRNDCFNNSATFDVCTDFELSKAKVKKKFSDEFGNSSEVPKTNAAVTCRRLFMSFSMP